RLTYGQPGAAPDFGDAVLHFLVNDAFEANARIVAEQTQLRIGRPTHARKKPQSPAGLAFFDEGPLHGVGVGLLEPLIRVDIENPVAPRLLDGEVARGGKVIAPGKF